MFTLIPSLYFVAVHYFRRWNENYYDNEEDTANGKNEIRHILDNNSIQSSNDKQSTELNDKPDNNLLQENNNISLNNVDYINNSSIYEKNGSNSDKISFDEDNQYNPVKLRIRKSIRSSSLLNVERCKTYEGDLSDDDIFYLINETGFTREQILLWHSDFLRDCPDGKLSKSKFIDIYQQFYKKGRVAKFCEHAFRVFDKDGSGYIDFVEFLIAVSMTSTKDPIRKTELFFSMYDLDRNGLIDKNEMRCVVESIYELMGIDIHDSTRIDSKVQEIFAKAECDQSGYLRKDQFVFACKTDRYIRKLLVPNTKAPNHR